MDLSHSHHRTGPHLCSKPDIVGTDPATVLHKLRDQAMLYMLNYLVLIIFIAGLSSRTAVMFPDGQ